MLSESKLIAHYLPELMQLEQLIANHSDLIQARTLARLPFKPMDLPLYEITLGHQDASAPCLIFVGGIHGVERIGSQIILAFLQALLSRLRWDKGLEAQLSHLRLLFYPIMNPTGMWRCLRSNQHGVDLMRNAPVDSHDKVPFLVGGHRISNSLPWYRGKQAGVMETENQVLCEAILQQTVHSPFSLLIDCHSGFGFLDRLWFPYAHTRKPFEHLPEIFKIKSLFEQSYPHYQYIIEPQALQYTTHGDLWDYLYQLKLKQAPALFLPLTLELGSWRWVKKNPKQLLSFLGLFNPVKPHRLQRTLRGHMLLFEFMINLTRAHQTWLPDEDERIELTMAAHRLWYTQPHKSKRG